MSIIDKTIAAVAIAGVGILDLVIGLHLLGTACLLVAVAMLALVAHELRRRPRKIEPAQYTFTVTATNAAGESPPITGLTEGAAQHEVIFPKVDGATSYTVTVPGYVLVNGDIQTIGSGGGGEEERP